MATVVELLAKLRADSSQFTAEMERAAKATEKVQTSAGQTSSSLNNMAGVFKKVATGAVALYVAKLGMDSVRAAQAASVAQDRLARLLLTTGGATEAQIKILNAHAAAMERSTVVSQANITTVQSQLATFDLHGTTIAQLTPAILDYVVAEKGASATADEYRQMTNGLAQALNGQFASLTAVGFVLDAETKAKIKSGTESERAIAITEVLNSTYKDFAKTSAGSVAPQVALAKQIEKLKVAFGTALLPVIQDVQKFLGAVLVPALQVALEAFTKFFGVIRNVGSFIGKYSIAFTMLAVAIGTYAAVTTVARIATSGLGKVMGLMKKIQQAYAFYTYTTTGATVGFAGAMNLLKTAFMTNPIGFIVTALAAVAVGFKLAWDRSETFRKVVIGVAKGSLKAVGFIIKVVGFLAEAFLNLVLGPLKLFLKVLGFINPDAKKAYEGLKGMTNNVGKFFDDAAKKVEGFGDSLDKYSKIPAKIKPKEEEVDLSGLGKATGGAIVDPKAAKKAADAAAKLLEMQRDLKKSVQNYNDFLKNDFAGSFMDGADSARSAVFGALDKLESVFEAKAKMLSGAPLAKLRKEFEKIGATVRLMAEEYAKVAGEIEAVSAKLEKAEADLEKAIESRTEAMKKFGELLRTPFGEPSAIDKAMRDSEATVDSIISMYDQLVETVNQRFAGMEQGAKSLVVNFLTDQTAALVKLAKRRSAAVDALKEAEDDLKKVLETQAAFQQKLSGGVKDFAKALITLSNADTKAVITVTKTASGLVISQVKKATSGVDAITNQLTARLKTVVDFGKNIEKLLAAGLSREYIQQLLEAGPDAASETAALLTTASAGQIAQINSLYTQINTQAEKFGKDMSDVFYGNSVAMAQAFVKGAAAEVANINAQIKAITEGIKIIMGVLGNTGLTSAQALIDGLIAGFGEANKLLVASGAQGVTDSVTKALDSLRTLGTSLAKDLAQGLFDQLTAEKARLVALAQSIAAAIAAAMASAAAAIGVTVDSGGGYDGSGGFESGPLFDDPEITPEPNKPDTSKKDDGKKDDGKKTYNPPNISVKPPVLKYGKFGESLVPGTAAYKAGTTKKPTFPIVQPNTVKSTSLPNFRPEAIKKVVQPNTVKATSMPSFRPEAT